MRCPRCTVDDDKVVDSRAAEDGSAIRRRRQCLACGFRFTTYERFEEVPIIVVKRSGGREPFERAKIVGGVRQAAKYRPVSAEQIEAVAAEIDEELRLSGIGEVTTQQVGVAVLDRLRSLDPVVYLRFASVYKGFEDPSDFEREATALAAVGGLTKKSEPKPSVPAASPVPAASATPTTSASPSSTSTTSTAARASEPSV